MPDIKRTARVFLQAAAIIFTIFALGVMAAALFTQSWQVVYAPEIEQYYMRGLFEECAWGSRFGRGTDVLCTFTMYDPSTTLGGWNTGWSNPYYGGGGGAFAGVGSFKFEPYRLTTLIFISLTMFLGLLGVIFCLCAGCSVFCAVMASIVNVLAELCACAGIICFYRNALDPINMVVLIVTRPAEQRIGYSFWVGVGGCIAFLVAMALTIGMTALLVFESRQGGYGGGSSSSHRYGPPLTRQPAPRPYPGTDVRHTNNALHETITKY